MACGPFLTGSARAKAEAKDAKARHEETTRAIEQEHAPALADAWAELDNRRIRYQNELEWLDQQDKESLVRGAPVHPRSKEGVQAKLDAVEIEAHRLECEQQKLEERKAAAEEAAMPLSREHLQAKANLEAVKVEVSNPP
jgi:hypothetical protein